jgi:hypothetical protein
MDVNRKAIAEAIRGFGFDDYGMDDVRIALDEDPDAQEWVSALADVIADALTARPGTDGMAEVRNDVTGEVLGYVRVVTEPAATAHELAPPVVLAPVPPEPTAPEASDGR